MYQVLQHNTESHSSILSRFNKSIDITHGDLQGEGVMRGELLPGERGPTGGGGG